MNLISDSERRSYQKAFVDLHDTFSQDIIVWSSAEQVVISSDGKFNSFYGQSQDSNIQIVPQSGVFKARIKYLTTQDLVNEIEVLSADERAKMSISLGGVRIRVSGDAAEMISKCEKVTFNNEAHIIFNRDRPHGLFGNDFYDFILQRIP